MVFRKLLLKSFDLKKKAVAFINTKDSLYQLCCVWACVGCVCVWHCVCKYVCSWHATKRISISCVPCNIVFIPLQKIVPSRHLSFSLVQKKSWIIYNVYFLVHGMHVHIEKKLLNMDRRHLKVEMSLRETFIFFLYELYHGKDA